MREKIIKKILSESRKEQKRVREIREILEYMHKDEKPYTICGKKIWAISELSARMKYSMFYGDGLTHIQYAKYEEE